MIALNSAMDLLEKRPNLTFKSGLIVAAVGFGLEVGIQLGVIEPTALNGSVSQTAPVFWVGGLTATVAALTIRVMQWAHKSLITALAGYRHRKETSDKLRDNLLMLNDEQRLLLYAIFKMAGGRHVSLGDYPPYIRLYGLGLVEPESPTLAFDKGVPKGLMRVAPQLYALRNGFQKQLVEHLEDAYGVDVSNQFQERKLMREFANRREQKQSGYRIRLQ